MTSTDPMDAYLRRLSWALRRLPESDREAIVREIGSHLSEHRSRGEAALAEALIALGQPHDLARNYLEEFDMSDAINRPAPFRLLASILNRAGRSASAAAVAFCAIVAYALALGFALMAALKPFMPDRVGGWAGADGFSMGVMLSPPSGPELLGWWAVPIGAGLALICYLAGTALLKTGARQFLIVARG